MPFWHDWSRSFGSHLRDGGRFSTETLTVVIIPSRGSRPRQIVLPRYLLYIAASMIIASLLCVSGILLWSGIVLVEARKARELRKEVARLESENARILILDETLRDLEVSQAKILSWAGMEAPGRAPDAYRFATPPAPTGRLATRPSPSDASLAGPRTSDSSAPGLPSAGSPPDRLARVRKATRAGWRWPVDGFVSRRYEPAAAGAEEHGGIDIVVPRDTPVVAASSGVVSFAGWDEQLGNMVVIDHPFGIATTYGHNAALLVAAGTRVTSGQTIARVGSTGRSSAPHLHFEVRYIGQSVDPEAYLAGDWNLP